MAPVLAASAAVYLGAAALKRPAAAWPLFFATVVLITVAGLLDDRFDPTWAILAGSVALLVYGLLRGASRPGYGLPLQTLALAGFGAVAAALLVNTRRCTHARPLPVLERRPYRVMPRGL